MIDCLFIGNNSQEFNKYLTMVRGLGEYSGAHRDLSLSFLEYEGRPYQALDLLSHLYERNGGSRAYPFHNADFLWPTVTYLGTFVSRLGFRFDFVNAFQYEKTALRDKLLNEDVLLVAIPTTLYVVPWPIQEIIEFVRQCNERVKIVVGGPYIANVAKGSDRELVETQFRALGADIYVISSEGEQALAALLAALKSHGDISGIDNIAYKKDGRFFFTKTSTERNSLEANLVDYKLFSPSAIGQFVSTRTAKSCPFSCAFCNFPQQAGKYTYMPVEAVERELDAIRDIGTVTTVTFIDDTFNVPRQRFAAILQMMIRKGYSRNFKWNCTLRSDHADDEIISLMAKAGCEGVFLGVESGSDQMLKAMNKTTRRKDYTRVIPRLKEEGILAHANTFIGFPGETFDSVEETLSLISETRPETFSAQPWYANPLTPVWKRVEEYGIEGSSFNWSHKTMDSMTACDLVDRIFLTVDDSIFLPQYGFFQWSLFYLQRHGMPLDRIKGYLNAFNALVRERLIGKVDESTHAALIQNLEERARFHGGVPSCADAITLYSGSVRVAAELYCVETFGDVDAAINGYALEQSLEPHSQNFVTVEVPTGNSSVRLTADVVLAALAIVLWRLDELREVLLLACLTEPVPLVLRPDPDQSFDAWVETVRASVREARRHRLHAFDILAGKTTLLPFRSCRPRFRAAVTVDVSDERPPYDDLPQAADVLMSASYTTGPPPSLHLRARCDAATLEPVAQVLSAVLTEAMACPEARVGDLAGTSTADPVPGWIEKHLIQTFEL